MEFLLDSVILIDHFNNITAATDYLKKVQGKCAISVITRAEVLAGFDSPEREIAAKFLDSFSLLGIDLTIADLAAVLRRQEKWKLPDAIQAALAKAHSLKLVTRNTKDFPPEKYDFVVVPYSL
ncbi:MAG: PIN domain-containing protein [Oscillatoria sp. PMC 1068.18]|nr:PIN domain-containing protein [Oscillatoria sp. PMC 1076.18]MEC4987820.1 PIN domain-containing protein [Oscillatoria sp. PMC 1068.18]